MTGRYPPGHGARHNGMRLDPAVPTIADALRRRGFATAAFVAAFPLDRRFGLTKGFQTYSDRMPRGPQGRLASERAGHVVADEAIAWLERASCGRFFLWVHLFEPHAPYGDPSDHRPVGERYDDEVAEADRQVARLVDALGTESASTLIVVAGDHGEAFGEHGEISHSVFVYDTTLRVPLVIAGPGIAPSVVHGAVGLVDLAPTLLGQLGAVTFDSDGIDSERRRLPAPSRRRASSTPSPSRRSSISAGARCARSARAAGSTSRRRRRSCSGLRRPGETAEPRGDRNARRRHRSTSAWSGSRRRRCATASPQIPRRRRGCRRWATRPEAAHRQLAPRPDPKDRRELAARIAQVTSGELTGAALRQALEQILARTPRIRRRTCVSATCCSTRGSALPRSGTSSGDCRPSAGRRRATWAWPRARRRRDDSMRQRRTLQQAEAAEPDNPVVVANAASCSPTAGVRWTSIPLFRRALTLDPDFNEARFNLALAHLRAGQDRTRRARPPSCCGGCPPDAPQRPEVERLREAARGSGK